MIKILKYILFTFLIFFSCKKNIKTLNLEKLQKKSIPDEYLNVKLIKSYPNETKCHEEYQNANIYLCKVEPTKDTILVIEPCKKMPDFAKNKKINECYIVIEKKNILDERLKSVYVNVPDRISLENRKIYILGSLTCLID